MEPAVRSPASQAAAFAPYAVQSLGTLPRSQGAVATAINDSGIIAGFSETFASGAVRSRAARWVNGVISDLGVLPGHLMSQANGINNAGVIVGISLSGFGSDRAFRWTQATGMVALPGAQSTANDINNSGIIVGYFTTSGGARHAARWSGGVRVDIHPAGMLHSWANHISDKGAIVGGVTLPGNINHAFLWRPNGTTVDLGPPGTDNGDALSMSNNGVIVGEGNHDGFRWFHNTLQFLGTTNWGRAADVSDLGRIVGTEEIYGSSVAYTWRNGVLSQLKGLGGGDDVAFAVNTCGTIVGAESNGAATRAVRWIARACDT